MKWDKHRRIVVDRPYSVDPLEPRMFLSAAPHVFDHGSIVAGASLGEWSARWWQWASSIPAAQNPTLDSTGENAGVGQSGPVFYLAGTFGTDPVERDIQVEAGKFLFFPLANIAWVPFTDEERLLGPDVTRPLIATFIDDVSTMSAAIDGREVPNLFSHREIDPFGDVGFDVTVPEGNIYGIEPDTWGPCTADGYWLMLSPLPAGTHTIEFTAQGGIFNQDITYNITVSGRRLPAQADSSVGQRGLSSPSSPFTDIEKIEAMNDLLEPEAALV